MVLEPFRNRINNRPNQALVVNSVRSFLAHYMPQLHDSVKEMKLEPTAEENIAQTAFCWKVYGQYGSEEKAIKAFRRRKGMEEFPPEEVKLWLEQALAVKNRLDEIKKEIVRGYSRPSLEHLAESRKLLKF